MRSRLSRRTGTRSAMLSVTKPNSRSILIAFSFSVWLGSVAHQPLAHGGPLPVLVDGVDDLARAAGCLTVGDAQQQRRHAVPVALQVQLSPGAARRRAHDDFAGAVIAEHHL